jgi:nucleoside 2-deoxyribosyltransferase
VSIDRINDPTVVAGIQNRIRETDFVIADVTEADPNVMIEVGIAIGMGKRLLLLASTRSAQLPVDLLALQVAVYRPDQLDAVKRYLQLSLRDELSERASFRAS